jgi:tungstate transport system substrate-binding protein
MVRRVAAVARPIPLAIPTVMRDHAERPPRRWCAVQHTNREEISMRGIKAVVSMLLLLAAMDPAATPLAAQGTPTAVVHTGPQDVILATTTSTADTGLLDALGPPFKEATGYTLKPIAVGSGAALALGERGEADVVLAHSPQAEQDFMEEGYGAERRTVMYNDFVIVGPEDDPAGIAGAASAVAAFQGIAESQARFVSRGDESGTNTLELRLWKEAGIEPAGDWYIESGTGMGETLTIANERGAYTVTDRGTYLALRDRLELPLLFEGDPALINIYHVITLNSANGPNINVAGGEAFLMFLLDPATQTFIGAFGIEEFGEPLFTPCADNSCGVEAAATPMASPAMTPAA